MIQTTEGKDRGQELFRMFPGNITNMVINRKKQWFDSQQFKGLRNNCRSMDAYIDNSSPAVSTFISDITPPVIRKAYTEFLAIFNKFLETDPLFSVRRSNKISAEQEKNIQAVLSDNMEKTYYRERCLAWSIDHIVRYGTAVTYSFATNDYNANSLMTVKGGEEESGDYHQIYQTGEDVVISTAVHPLNAIVDPRSNFMVEPDFMGFIGDIAVSSIANLLDNPAYIQQNLKEIFSQCKQGLPDEHWFGGSNYEGKRDYTRGHSNITYLWTRLPFEGNEDDPTWYPVEEIGGKIIRIEESPLDGNTIPIAIKRVLPRQYTWYGNSPLADKICIQNMTYWLINTTVESTARLMDRIVLYREGTLDIEAINSRHLTGGLIPYRGQEPDLSKLVYSPDMPNRAYRESDWLMQEMRREDQDSNAMPNFNPQSEGGPTNRTLGGAQMMASIGELKAGNLVNQMAIGLKDVAKHVLVLLRNISGDTINLKNGQSVPKNHLLGDVSFTCKISNVFNYILEGKDSQNRLSQLINFRATQLPEFNAVKMSQYIEDWVRNSIKRENIDDYVDSAKLREIEKQSANPQPQQPPAPQPKQPNISINYKDIPPDAQQQVLAEAGIKLGSMPGIPMAPPVPALPVIPGGSMAPAAAPGVLG
jgi:hypothetical protein